MTQRTQIVEPPFARRPVQLSLALLASVTCVWLLIPDGRRPPSGQPPGLAVTEGAGLNLGPGSIQQPALIQIDLNTAHPRELALLPRVGPILAKRIEVNRRRLGRFRSIDDLGRVHGIGPKTLERIRHLCVVDPQEDRGPGKPDRRSVGRLASARPLAEADEQGGFDRAGR